LRLNDEDLTKNPRHLCLRGRPDFRNEYVILRIDNAWAFNLETKLCSLVISCHTIHCITFHSAICPILQSLVRLVRASAIHEPHHSLQSFTLDRWINLGRTPLPQQLYTSMRAVCPTCPSLSIWQTSPFTTLSSGPSPISYRSTARGPNQQSAFTPSIRLRRHCC